MELQNCIENNYNDKKAEIKLSDLFNNDIIIKPDFQRDLDEERCQKIYENMEKFYQENKNYRIFGTIYFCKLNENLYLIDGQHRLNSAFNMYKTTNLDILVDIHIYSCKNMEEMYKIFQILNFNQSIPKWMQNIEKNDILVVKNVIEKIKNKYGKNIVSNDIHVQFPKFNISKFFDICKKYNFFEQCNQDQILDYIEKLNNDVFISLEKNKSIDSIDKKLQKLQDKFKFGDPIFYLGSIRLSNWDKYYKKKLYNNLDDNMYFHLSIL